MSLLTPDEFFAKYNGQTKGYPTDANYKGECLSIVKLYIKECHGILPPASGSGAAYGYWSNFPDPLGTVFEKVEAGAGRVPVKGDIPIWNTNVGGGFGHIDICISANENIFVGFDQNWNGRQAHEQNHNYQNVVGWLHPKGAPVSEIDDLKKQVKDLQEEVKEKNTQIENLQGQVNGFVKDIETGELVRKAEVEKKEKLAWDKGYDVGKSESSATPLPGFNPDEFVVNGYQEEITQGNVKKTINYTKK